MPSLTGNLVRVGRFAWHQLPPALLESRLFRRLGTFIHRHATRDQLREQSHSTWFMRNPPLLEALRDSLADWPPGAGLQVASVACSTGVELYSTVFFLRTARPDLNVAGLGIDLSEGVVAAAREGVYRWDRPASGRGLFAPGPPELKPDLAVAEEGWQSALFVEENGSVRVKDWVRRGTSWLVADARNPGLADLMKPQDIVLANNFLGPMDDHDAERSLRNVAALVRPGGLLVVDGVDLDLKVRVLSSIGATPQLDRLEAIYHADPTKRGWPWIRWAHEPIDRTRPDWELRYSTLYVLGASRPVPRSD